MHRNVVIVGGGVSGVTVAIHMLRRGNPELRIDLVERSPWLGRGIAYRVDNAVFRLNVPAGKMRLDPGRPDDFTAWAGAESAQFLPRATFGAYVLARFREDPAEVADLIERAGDAAAAIVAGQ